MKPISTGGLQLRADWEPRFNAWLADAIAKPHKFGEHDCILTFAGAVEAQTGRDLAEGHRGKWKNRAEARRYLKSLGFARLEKLIDTLLDWIPPAFAQRGDIAVVDDVPGVVIGGEALFWHDGLTEPARVPRAKWDRAWSVGARTVGAGK